jgi:hypothetical protein
MTDLVLLDREVALAILGNPAVERLITITGVNVIVAAGLVAVIGDIRRCASPPGGASSRCPALRREVASAQTNYYHAGRKLACPPHP